MFFGNIFVFGSTMIERKICIDSFKSAVAMMRQYSDLFHIHEEWKTTTNVRYTIEWNGYVVSLDAVKWQRMSNTTCWWHLLYRSSSCVCIVHIVEIQIRLSHMRSSNIESTNGLPVCIIYRFTANNRCINDYWERKINFYLLCHHLGDHQSTVRFYRNKYCQISCTKQPQYPQAIQVWISQQPQQWKRNNVIPIMDRIH